MLRTPLPLQEEVPQVLNGYLDFLTKQAALRVILAVTWLTVYRQLHMVRSILLPPVGPLGVQMVTWLLSPFHVSK